MNRVTEIAAQSAQVMPVRGGDKVTVVDVEGNQVADLWCLIPETGEALSASRTRIYHQRLFPHLGDVFVTNRRRPILALVADHSPGYHDLLCPPCGPEYYRDQGIDGWHPSCEENFRIAVGRQGLDIP